MGAFMSVWFFDESEAPKPAPGTCPVDTCGMNKCGQLFKQTLHGLHKTPIGQIYGQPIGGLWL